LWNERISIFALHSEKGIAMKEGIHPSDYRYVVFKDMSNEQSFLTKSCAQSKETIVWEDGNEYPVIKLEISSSSHPFYTGKMKLVDTAGRVDKFRSRYSSHRASQAKSEEV
jgi:large subunit ribosomal protein L31